MIKEIWKPISTSMYFYSDLINTDYEVSNMGRIRNAKTGKEIHPFPNQKGNKRKWTMHGRYSDGWPYTLQFLVDHTVYEAFVGLCYEKELKHKDGNNFNDALENLCI